ncbi:hypothetical protein J6TS7_64860 [Paenibacillus dendritiformis]|nr:hypothetical protein J6TS7_64860 [Paenibacillus dendritiformis]
MLVMAATLQAAIVHLSQLKYANLGTISKHYGMLLNLSLRCSLKGAGELNGCDVITIGAEKYVPD